MPPTVLFRLFARSGLHRARRSGRGLPITFLVPLVMMKATASETARPIQPAFHSQSLRRNDAPLELASAVAGPRPMNIAMTKTTTAGTTSPKTMSRPVLIFSFETYGKEISGSVMLKGRLLGVMTENAAPTAAMALSCCEQDKKSCKQLAKVFPLTLSQSNQLCMRVPNVWKNDLWILVPTPCFCFCSIAMRGFPLELQPNFNAAHAIARRWKGVRSRLRKLPRSRVRTFGLHLSAELGRARRSKKKQSTNTTAACKHNHVLAYLTGVPRI